jgi:hypothetical protein
MPTSTEPSSMSVASSVSIAAVTINATAPEPLNVQLLIDAVKRYGYHPARGTLLDEHSMHLMAMLGCTPDGRIAWMVADPKLYPSLPVCPLFMETYETLRKASHTDGLPGFIMEGGQRMRAILVRHGAGLAVKLEPIRS